MTDGTDSDRPPAPRDDDHPREACGVFGIVQRHATVAPLAADGLHALQHRGQESAGIAVSDGATITVIKDMGLVTDVFDRATLGGLVGELAIGHTRYSTTGRSVWANAQPIFRAAGDVSFAIGHNGNLTNTRELAEELPAAARHATSDSDVIGELLAAELDSGRAKTLEDALATVLPRLQGAFSLVLMDTERLIGVRDPNGFRPLCLGRVEGGWVLASETCALDIVGAEFLRDIEPGEMLVVELDQDPRHIRAFDDSHIEPKLCIFEFVYMARPDSRLYGRQVHGARVRMGRALARQDRERGGIDADVVIGVPESGIPAAEGYAAESGLPYSHGLVKNRYIGRTFINPTQEDRERAVRRKLNVLEEQVAGKRLVVVEDSVIRGTTTRSLAHRLRAAGAQAVHLRVALPPVKWPCYFGVDIGSTSELLSAQHTEDEIREILGVDSIAYLTLPELTEAIDVPAGGFCDACMTKNYPVWFTSRPAKDALEDAEPHARV